MNTDHAIGAFDWHSVKPSTLKRMPKSETFVMVATVVLVLITHNLAVGVVGGVLVASVLFVRRVAHFVSVNRVLGEAGDVVTYVVEGELFFASSHDLTTLFSYTEDPDRVVVDLSGSHVACVDRCRVGCDRDETSGAGEDAGDRRDERLQRNHARAIDGRVRVGRQSGRWSLPEPGAAERAVGSGRQDNHLRRA